MMMIGSPLISRRYDTPEFDGEELVVVPSPFFPHSLAQGYWQPPGWVVKSVDGTRIRNLQHLVEMLRDGRDDDVVIDFIGRGMETFVFSRAAMLGATEDVLNDNGLRAQGRGSCGRLVLGSAVVLGGSRGRLLRRDSGSRSQSSTRSGMLVIPPSTVMKKPTTIALIATSLLVGHVVAAEEKAGVLDDERRASRMARRRGILLSLPAALWFCHLTF